MNLFYDQLNEILETKPEYLETFMRKEIATFFSTPQIYSYYQLLKDVTFHTNTSKLIMAWLALLSGDNPHLMTYANSIDETKLSKQEQVLFYDLKALSGVFDHINARLALGKEAIEISENDHSFYKANAHLTYGQLLVGIEKLREAADHFKKGYVIFKENQLYFPSAVSLTNALLNWFRLGEFQQVIEEAEQALLQASTYQSSDQTYWETICLPLGMCYFEQNKPALALDYLLRAKSCIDSMNLIHMHGYIEIYLIKTYHLLGNKQQVKQLTLNMETLFKHMHYPQMQIMLSLGKVLTKQSVEIEVERLEVQYQQSRQNQFPLLAELLAYLSVNQLSESFEKEQFIELMNHYRYIGDLVSLQQIQILLADYYYRQNEMKEANLILEEANRLYNQYQLKAAFYLYDYQFWPLLHKLNPKIKTPKSKESELLTERERDILQLIAEGKSNQEVGDVLYISVGTVKWHINHIFSKLAVKSRIQAVEEAKKLNLL